PGHVNLIAADGSIYNPTAFILTTAEGFSYTIDQSAGLSKVTDLNGNTLTITHDGVLHSSGQSVVFHRDAQDRITSIVDPQGNTIYYGYDPDLGDLQSFTDQSHNTTFYGYNLNPRHLLSTITDPRGITVLTNGWGGPGGNQLGSTQDSAIPNKSTVSYNLN